MKKILLLLTVFAIHAACTKESVIVTEPITVAPPIDKTQVGVFNGAYGLAGTFTVDGSGITINDDYQGNTAPGPVWYLSNNEKGVSDGIRLENARKGAGGYKIETNQALDYQYLVLWCQPFSIYIGHGKIKD